MKPLLRVCGALISARRVNSVSVVEDLNALAETLNCLLLCLAFQVRTEFFFINVKQNSVGVLFLQIFAVRGAEDPIRWSSIA